MRRPRLLTLLSATSLLVCLAVILLRFLWRNPTIERTWTPTTFQHSDTLFTARSLSLQYRNHLFIVGQFTTRVTLSRQGPSPTQAENEKLSSLQLAAAKARLDADPNSPRAKEAYLREFNWNRFVSEQHDLDQQLAELELHRAHFAHEDSRLQIQEQQSPFLFPAVTQVSSDPQVARFLRLTFIAGTDSPFFRHYSCSHWSLIIPDFYLIALTLLLPLLQLASFLRHHRRRRTLPGHCHTCNYDLRASKNRCPECGTPIPPPASPTPHDP